MKKILITVALGAMFVSAKADITVNVNPATGMKEYAAEYAYIADLVKPRMERPAPFQVSGNLSEGSFTIPQMAEGAARYIIPTGGNEYIMLFTQPGDNLVVNINSVNPLQYDVTGSKLMEDIATLDKEASKISQQYMEMQASGNVDRAAAEALGKAYTQVYKDFIANNPESAAAGFAMMHLEGEDFLNAFDAMSAAIQTGPFYPMLAQQKTYEERSLVAERKRAALESGTVDAPNFTLKDLNGKPVSLTDFRGKWVVLDFWGSWCRWCIKGFPELKEAYAKYKPELEVIGVDCQDEMETWKNAVKKYDLPWVNVYNPEETAQELLQAYGVEGFPTKAIVNPEGKIVNITVGENPEFFNILAKLMGK